MKSRKHCKIEERLVWLKNVTEDFIVTSQFVAPREDDEEYNKSLVTFNWDFVDHIVKNIIE